MQLMGLHKIWRNWLNASFANQITLFALSLTLGASLLIGAGSYLVLRAQIEATIQHGLAVQAAQVEAHLSHDIDQARAELETLSRNSFVSNGLVDSLGRDAYLRPFLRDFRLSIPGKEDTALTLYDFRGKPLIAVSPDQAIASASANVVDAEEIGQAIATGKSQVRIITQGKQTYFQLVQPIHFPPTQSVEGALAVRIQLAPLLADTDIAPTESQFLQLHAADAVVAQIGVSRQDVLRVERALKLDAPFDTLGLRITLDSSTRDARGPLDRLTLIYGLGLLIILPLVGWVTQRSSRRLVVPLVELSATANAIARSGVITVPLKIGDANEVGRLADALGRMLKRLGAAQAELNNQTANLLAHDQLLQSVLDSALDAFIRIDGQGQVTDWNLRAERMFGYSRADAVGKLLENLIIPPSLQEAHRRGIEHFLNTGEGPLLGKIIELTAMRASGGEFPVEIAIVESRSGNAVYFNAFLRDISARKQAEEEIRQLNATLERRVIERTVELNQFKNTLDQTLEAVFIFDPDTLRFTYVNEGAKRQTGYSQTELTKMTPLDIKPLFKLDEFQKILQPLRTGRLPSLTYQTVHRHKDGHEIAVEIFLQFIRLEGQAPRFVAMANDISERKQTEEEIRQLNVTLERRVIERTAELQAANQEMEAFSYSVSHDLRAPLRAIDGFSQALLEDYAGKLDDQGKDYLKRVRSATQRMGHLIDDMLTLSRVTRVQMRRETVDLSALAANVLAELLGSEPERKVDCRIEPGLIAEGDANLLRVVLDNLLRNTWKFTDKTANAKIEFGAMRNDEGATEFFVRDNGAGFDTAHADKLFGVFQRLHLASEFPGTGVGLATVQRIIHRHGGQIRGLGIPNQGATFCFTLPG